MKISLAWVFDYIAANWRDCDVTQLVGLFNQKVAEIEAFYPVNLDIDQLFLGKVISVAHQTVELHVGQLDVVVELPRRQDIQLDQLFILKKKDDQWHYAIGKDFYSQKVTELPAVYCKPEDVGGGWKRHIDAQDYILEVDNKSITHRPDLWSHYGFAREIAILLGLQLKPLCFERPLPVVDYALESNEQKDVPFVARITSQQVKCFAFVYFDHIENNASMPWMLARLCRIDGRPISTIVDLTNYVMFDVGQPLHAFDSDKFTSNVIEARMAQDQEVITLLDDETITLTNHDLVISNGSTPVALAGIMGGSDTAVSSDTKSIMLEAANFDATTVRISTMRHKKRTESSTRFEKTLDPNQNSIALERFVQLLQVHDIAYTASCIVSVGAQTHPLTIDITQDYIQTRLGVSIEPRVIVAILEALGCQVKQNTHEAAYSVMVPTVRSTKDITTKEDLLEEIGRLYGYTNIPYHLPRKQTEPTDAHLINTQRAIKRQLSFGFSMYEVKNYAFFNESFLQELRWQPEQAVTIQSPVSQQYQTLVTSLIPGLLCNIKDNHIEHEQVCFFEWARIWSYVNNVIEERGELAGIFYHKKDTFSFYDLKAYIQSLCAMLHIPVTWHKVIDPKDPWFAPYQTAHIKYQNRTIGTVGMINVAFTHHIISGHMAAFSLDGDFFKQFKPAIVPLQTLAKYPSVTRDVSMMIPVDITVQKISEVIQSTTALIKEVWLIDFFQKDAWKGERSVAFRYVIRDDFKTLAHQEVEAIVQQVVNALQALGASIR